MLVGAESVPPKPYSEETALMKRRQPDLVVAIRCVLLAWKDETADIETMGVSGPNIGVLPIMTRMLAKVCENECDRLCANDPSVRMWKTRIVDFDESV
jgi:hypothetical protein